MNALMIKNNVTTLHFIQKCSSLFQLLLEWITYIQENIWITKNNTGVKYSYISCKATIQESTSDPSFKLSLRRTTAAQYFIVSSAVTVGEREMFFKKNSVAPMQNLHSLAISTL